MEKQNTTAKTVGAVVITAMLLIGIYIFILNNKPSKTLSVADSSTAAAVEKTSAASDAPVLTDTSKTTTNNTADTTPVAASVYTDGTYQATGSYSVPHGDINSITVTITVKADSITAVSTTNQYRDRESLAYINSFKSGISGVVVGKKLDRAKVGRVNGSSLTGEGFNAALSAIINKAKA